MTTEYYEINIPTDLESAIRALEELHAHLIRISERLNDLEERIETLEAA